MDKQKENFERLVRSHKDTIYTVCYMFSKDEDEVADLFQETLINVWRGLPKYQGGDEALRGWIYRVALNTCISLNRSKRRRKTVPLTMDVNFFDPQEERAQRVDQLHRRIARLQPFDRAIVLLWLIRSFSAHPGADEENEGIDSPSFERLTNVCACRFPPWIAAGKQ